MLDLSSVWTLPGKCIVAQIIQIILHFNSFRIHQLRENCFRVIVWCLSAGETTPTGKRGGTIIFIDFANNKLFLVLLPLI